MINIIRSKYSVLFLLAAIIISLAPAANGDEMLSLYGLKGYAYTYSPLPADGFHLQTGVMYSLFKTGNVFHDDNLNCRDGYVWVAPVSLTYGDGNLWEVAAAAHYEYWKNTDYDDVDESGIGDLFLGGKVRVLSQDKKMPFDLSLMPYIVFPTGNQDKSIGDLYRYSPSDDDEISYGANLLLGRRLKRFYFTGNIGVNYMDNDSDSSTLFYGMAIEYQISESLNSYAEFFNSEHRNTTIYPVTSQCYDKDSTEDIRELGIGIVWLKGRFGIKLHTGFGMTATSPDIRGIALFNVGF
ncbi:MAG: transporter [Desulfobacteraceae bacterium]|nr:transporter [Desulfobacteraceae bacterium]